jgi:hypothetical protein
MLLEKSVYAQPPRCAGSSVTPEQHCTIPRNLHGDIVDFGAGSFRAPHYTGPASDPAIERLTLRAYSRRRSRIVDHWLLYADAEGLLGQAGEVLA